MTKRYTKNVSRLSMLDFSLKNIQKLFLPITLAIFFFIPVSAYACTVTATPSSLPGDGTNTLVTFNVTNNNNWDTDRITVGTTNGYGQNTSVQFFGQQTPITGWNASTFIGGFPLDGRAAEWFSSNYSTYFIPANTNFSFSTYMHSTQDLSLAVLLNNFVNYSNDLGYYDFDKCYINLPAQTNNPPTINSIPNNTINEGDTYTANGSFTDSDSTSWTGTVDYGDGTGVHAFASPNESLNQTNQTFNLSHVYKDEGTYTVTVKITDNQGATGTGTATITVNNATPSVGAITVSTNPVQINTATSASATFTDAGVLDTHTATWNWGDGTTPTTGTISESNGSGTVGADSHTYTAAGVYTITLTVTDDDGTQPGTQTFQYVSVYNPTSQGLFSAGQRFTSPSGAYPSNPNLTGNVTFGLSYKYQGTMPVGDRQFSMNFNAANLTFNATTISSLVIANGIGTLTGTGTLNGSGTYTFLVTGSESANTIRIQITDSSNTVIYDTQPGAAATATPTTSVTGHILAH